MIKYRPYWQRIIFLAVLINFIAIFVISTSWTNTATEHEEELQEVELIEEIPKSVETFPEIKFPPILTEQTPPPIETPQEKIFSVENKIVENKSEGEKEKFSDDSVGKLKVLPRDIIAELMSSENFSKGNELKVGKVILSVTIGTDGKIKNVEILSNSINDENGNLINILSEAAAMRWIFEPFKDTDGNRKKLKRKSNLSPKIFKKNCDENFHRSINYFVL